MKVYHGSYIEIDTIDLSLCKPNKDFGKGFYVTKYRKQAEEWADIMQIVHKEKSIVTEFTFYERAFEEKDLQTLRFTEYNDDWFDFVILNRDVNFTENRHDYDIIEGPVADDKIQKRIDKFISGEISREVFFEQIKYEPPSHQICFCTINSLRMLKKENNSKICKLEDISEMVVQKLVIDFNIDEKTAADHFFSSKTFSQLADSTTKFYEKPCTEIYELLIIELNIK